MMDERVTRVLKPVVFHKFELDSTPLHYRDSHVTSGSTLGVPSLTTDSLPNGDRDGGDDGFQSFMDDEARKRRELELEQHADSEYDTDLEDNDERVETPFDAHGRRTYLRACRKLKLVPVSRVARDLLTSSLVLRDRGLGERHALAISHALMENTSVTELFIEDNPLNETAFSYLCSALYDNLYVTSLSFRNTGMSYNSAKNICDLLLHNHLIKDINLSENRLEDNVALLLGHTLEASRSLKVINLSHNQFTDAESRALAIGIGENDCVTDLDLSWNHIRSSGAQKLCKEIAENVMLKRLNLEMNGLGDHGAESVADMLKENRCLQELNISGNRIADKGAVHLGKALETNQTLQVIKMTNNPMTSAGVYAILSSLNKSVSPSLRLVDIRSVNVQQDVLDLYQTVRQQRNELVVVLGGLIQTCSSTYNNSLSSRT